jgi:glycoside hydrolase, family 19, putative
MEENKKTNTAIVRFSSGRGNQMEIKFPKVKSSKTCFCNRNFSVSELKEIIKALRERTPYTKNLNLYEFTGDNLFSKAKEGDNILGEEYCDYNLFTYQLNLFFEQFNITKCIHKIHFLAQSFVETQHFRVIEEKRPSDKIKGGKDDFKGRGLLHVSHDYNYLYYYDNLYEKTYSKPYKKEHKIGEGVVEFVERIILEKEKSKEAYPYKLDLNFVENILKPFSKTLATNLTLAIHSATWYWHDRNINESAEKDDVLEVSKKINGTNGTPNAYSQREKYTNDLKDIFKYKECINNPSK